jgi:hypothetical protein
MASAIGGSWAKDARSKRFPGLSVTQFHSQRANSTDPTSLVCIHPIVQEGLEKEDLVSASLAKLKVAPGSPQTNRG